MNTPSDAQKTVAVTPLPDLNLLAAALGHSARWKILKELSAGEPRMVRELAQVARCSPDMASKHLAKLRKAGGGSGSRTALPDSEAISFRARRTRGGLRPLPAPAGCGGGVMNSR